MTTIEIREVQGNELHHQYPRQTAPQPVQVVLDCEKRTLTARHNPEIGNAVPVREYHGHVQTWTIPALKAEAANALLTELAPLAERVCDGYESHWNGNNHVARFDTDANSALEAIDDARNRDWGESDRVRVWSADDYFSPIGTTKSIAAQLGVTATTTDEELQAIADREENAALSDGIDELTGAREYMFWLREQVRE
jgi:hypothetical protein